MTFALKIRQQTLKGMVSILSSIVDEAKVVYNADGLEIVCVDAAHVAMVGMTIPKSEMTEYTAEEGEFGLDLNKMASILRLVSPNETVSMELNDGRLMLRFGNIQRTMAVLDTEGMTTPKVPKMQMSASVVTTSATLQNATKGVQDIGDAITMRTVGGSFIISSESDLDSAEFKGGDDVMVSGEDACSIFPKDYIIEMVKAVPSSYKVMVNLDNDYPVKVDFADGDVTGFFLIAPRIESEGE